MGIKVILKQVKSIGKTVLFAVVAALFINIFIFELYSVEGISMEPNFHEGDHVFALKVKHLLRMEPDYGDVVIVDGDVQKKRTLKDEFIDNALVSKILHRENQNIWIKRVIGKPGDTLEFKEGSVYRNNKKLEETYINEPMKRGFSKIVVPPKYIYVMGDNRNYSKDSRIVGPIPIENVRGEVLFRIFPRK